MMQDVSETLCFVLSRSKLYIGSPASVKSKKYLWRVAFVMWFNSMAKGHQPASKERLKESAINDAK